MERQAEKSQSKAPRTVHAWQTALDDYKRHCRVEIRSIGFSHQMAKAKKLEIRNEWSQFAEVFDRLDAEHLSADRGML